MGVLYGTTLNASDSALRRLTNDQLILAQGVTLIIITEPGSLWSSPESGYGLLALVGKGLTTIELLAEGLRAKAAVEYDPRIARCEATLIPTFVSTGQAALRLSLKIYPKDPAVAPFQLVTTAGAAAVQTVVRGL
jgi:hypothetical protein